MTRSRDVADTQDNLGGAVAPFVAGKNKIINGDFGVWQRGTSFTQPSGVAFGYSGADRWIDARNGGGTVTISRQAFTPGTAPVAGYEGKFFYRYAQSVAGSGQTYSIIGQRIEDVQTLAGQTATISFWAKADASRTITSNFNQNFGSGGSGSTNTSVGSFNLTTSWTRFTATINVPSLTGSTIGTSSFAELQFQLPLNTTMTIDLWGVQVEAGSVATPFTTASGSIGGELALCQRYYQKSYGATDFAGAATPAGVRYVGSGTQGVLTTLQIIGSIPFSIMRTTPTVVIYDDAGNINKCTRFAAGVNIYVNEAITVDYQINSNFRLYSASGTAAGGFYVQYTLSAEL